MTEVFANGFAVLVGVGRCRYAPWSLPATSRDAEALKLTLTDPRHCGYPDENIRLLTNENATRKRILATMKELGEVIADVPDSTLIVFYSGHGWLDEKGRYFLMPHDTDPYRFSATALSGKRFTKALRRMRPSRLLVLLDTCHAGGMAAAKESLPGLPAGHKAPPEGLAEALGAGNGRAVLSSCRGEETSLVLPERNLSLFTHHLIEGLAGAASSGESYVSVLDLGRYISRQVALGAEQLKDKQTPFFKAETEDFPVALFPGFKEVESPGSPDPAPPQASGPSDKRKFRAGRDIVQIQAQEVGPISTGASTTHNSKKPFGKEK